MGAGFISFLQAKSFPDRVLRKEAQLLDKKPGVIGKGLAFQSEKFPVLRAYQEKLKKEQRPKARRKTITWSKFKFWKNWNFSRFFRCFQRRTTPPSPPITAVPSTSLSDSGASLSGNASVESGKTEEEVSAQHQKEKVSRKKEKKANAEKNTLREERRKRNEEKADIFVKRVINHKRKLSVKVLTYFEFTPRQVQTIAGALWDDINKLSSPCSEADEAKEKLEKRKALFSEKIYPFVIKNRLFPETEQEQSFYGALIKEISRFQKIEKQTHYTKNMINIMKVCMELLVQEAIEHDLSCRKKRKNEKFDLYLQRAEKKDPPYRSMKAVIMEAGRKKYLNKEKGVRSQE